MNRHILPASKRETLIEKEFLSAVLGAPTRTARLSRAGETVEKRGASGGGGAGAGAVEVVLGVSTRRQPEDKENIHRLCLQEHWRAVLELIRCSSRVHPPPFPLNPILRFLSRLRLKVSKCRGLGGPGATRAGHTGVGSSKPGVSASCLRCVRAHTSWCMLRGLF